MPQGIGGLRLAPLPGAVPAWRASVDSDGLRRVCEAVAGSGGRLGALWASDERDRGAGFALHTVLVAFEGLVCVDIRLEGETYADVSDIFPAAGRMQRAIADLMGLRAGMRDTRGWLRHGAWREDAFPLRRDVALDACLPAGDPRYAFVPVEGEGVHEIPVGPVHAGIIEPGHFRFSVVGERVLRLEERLGYTHKGVEKRFESLSLEEGARLAARVSGDSSVAFSWAYAMALETAAACKVPERALWLRALLLERERVANHLGDLGALGNDGGLAFGLAQFSRMKEHLLRNNAALGAHRRAFRGGVRIAGAATQDPPRPAVDADARPAARNCATRIRHRLDRRLARRGARRRGGRRRRADTPLPSARSFVAELACARARRDRQHRSGLPADQQVVQPVIRRSGPLAMHKILLQIARVGIKTEPAPPPDEALRRAAARMSEEMLQLLGRALAIRHVDAGSCNACELEIHATNNPYYNLEGLGIKFVASPRHADMLLVTGPVSRNMEEALRRTYEATPEPKLVVAIGDCGCGKGIFGENYASCGAVSNVIPVDVAVPGCPPDPAAIMRGILTAVTASAKGR